MHLHLHLSQPSLKMKQMPKSFSYIISKSIKTSENLPLNILITLKTANTLPKKNCNLPLQTSNLLLSCSHFLHAQQGRCTQWFCQHTKASCKLKPGHIPAWRENGVAKLRSYWQLRAALILRLSFSLRPYSKWIRLQGKATHSEYMGSTYWRLKDTKLGVSR